MQIGFHPYTSLLRIVPVCSGPSSETARERYVKVWSFFIPVTPLELFCEAFEPFDDTRFSVPLVRIGARPRILESLANSKGYSADDVLPLSACKVLPADEGVERTPGKPSPMFTFPDGINNLGSVLLLGLPASNDVLLLSRVNPLFGVGVEAVSDSEVIG